MLADESSPAAVAPGPVARRLPALLGTWFGVAVAVGSMIGAGILRAPHDVAARLPTPGLFLGAWVIGGLYALLGANALAELGAMRPRSGGQYAFARHAFGPFAGFVVGWNDWLSSCASVAAIAFVFAETAAALARQAALGRAVLAVAAIAATTLVLWGGVRVSDRAQRITSAAKALAFLVLVAACLAHAASHGRPDALAPTHTPEGAALLATLVVALQGVVFAYDGWVGVLYFGEEVREPGREIPRALFGGVLSVMALYLLVNVALLAALPLAAIAREQLPAAAAADAVFGGGGAAVVRAIVVVALPSALVANLLMASRVAFALGRDAPPLGALAKTAGEGTPRTAIAVSAAATSAFALSGTFERVIALCVLLFVASYAVSFAAVFVLRRREPHAPRPWRAAGHPWTTGLVLAGSVSFLAGTVAAAPRDAAIVLALVALAYPAFRLMRR